MANVGPIISLASIAAVRDEIEYLEDEMDLDHAGYPRWTSRCPNGSAPNAAKLC